MVTAVCLTWSCCRIAELYDKLEYGPAPEDPAAANAWLADHDKEFGNFIDNKV